MNEEQQKQLAELSASIAQMERDLKALRLKKVLLVRNIILATSEEERILRSQLENKPTSLQYQILELVETVQPILHVKTKITL